MNNRHDDDYNFLFKSTLLIVLIDAFSYLGRRHWRWKDSPPLSLYQRLAP